MHTGRHGKNTKTVKLLALIAGAAVLMLTVVPLGLLFLGDLIFAPGTPEEIIKRSTGADLDGCEIREYCDDHGGPHGDGTTVIIADCSASPLDPAALRYWKKCPVSENIADSLWTVQNKIPSTYANGVDRALRDGYYYFEDRFFEAISDRHSDEKLTKRGSFNFTLAVYDRKNDTLYYFERDT